MSGEGGGGVEGEREEGGREERGKKGRGKVGREASAGGEGILSFKSTQSF